VRKLCEHSMQRVVHRAVHALVRITSNHSHSSMKLLRHASCGATVSRSRLWGARGLATATDDVQDRLRSSLLARDVSSCVAAFQDACTQSASISLDELASLFSLFVSSGSSDAAASAVAALGILVRTPASSSPQQRMAGIEQTLVDALSVSPSIETLHALVPVLQSASVSDPPSPLLEAASRAILDELATRQDFTGMRKVLDAMSAYACAPTAAAAQAWMAWLQQQGRHSEALVVFDRLYSQGMPLQDDCLQMALLSCRQLNEPQRGMRYWRAVQTRERLAGGGGAHTMPLLQRLGGGQPGADAAAAALPEPFVPSAHSWESFIACCADAGQRGVAMDALYQMRDVGIAPTAGAFCEAIRACAVAGAPPMALSLFDEARSLGLQLPAGVYAHLLQAAVEKASVDTAAEVLLLWTGALSQQGAPLTPEQCGTLEQLHTLSLRAVLRASTKEEERARRLPPALRGGAAGAKGPIATPDPDDEVAAAAFEPTEAPLAPAYSALRPPRQPVVFDATSLLAVSGDSVAQDTAAGVYGRRSTVPACREAGLQAEYPVVGDVVTDIAALHTVLFGQLSDSATPLTAQLQGALMEYKALHSIPVASAFGGSDRQVELAWGQSVEAFLENANAEQEWAPFAPVWPWARGEQGGSAQGRTDVAVPTHMLPGSATSLQGVPVLDTQPDLPPATVTGISDSPADWPGLALRWLQDARAARRSAVASGQTTSPSLSTWHYGAVIRAAAAVSAAGHAARPVWVPLSDVADLAEVHTARHGALAMDRNMLVAEAALGALLVDGAPLDERLLAPLMHLYASPHLRLPHLAPALPSSEHSDDEDEDSSQAGPAAGLPDDEVEVDIDGSWHWGLNRARLLLGELVASTTGATQGSPEDAADSEDEDGEGAAYGEDAADDLEDLHLGGDAVLLDVLLQLPEGVRGAATNVLKALLGEDFDDTVESGGLVPTTVDHTRQPSFPFPHVPESSQLPMPIPQEAVQAAVRGCSSRDSYHLGFSLLYNLTLEHGTVPGPAALEALLQACCDAGAEEEAVAFLEAAAAHQVPITRDMGDILISVAVTTDQPAVAERTLAALSVGGVRLSPATLALLRGAGVIAEQHAEFAADSAAQDAYEAMLDAQYAKSLSVFGRDVHELVAGATRAGGSAGSGNDSDSGADSDLDWSDSDDDVLAPEQVARGIMMESGAATAGVAERKLGGAVPPATPRRGRRSVFGVDDGEVDFFAEPSPAVPSGGTALDDEEEEGGEWGGDSSALLQELDEGEMMRYAVRAHDSDDDDIADDDDLALPRGPSGARGGGSAASARGGKGTSKPSHAASTGQQTSNPTGAAGDAAAAPGMVVTQHVPVVPHGTTLTPSQRRVRKKALPLVTPEQDEDFKSGINALIADGALPSTGLVSQCGHFVIPLHAGVAMTGPQKSWLRYVHDEGPLIGLTGEELRAMLHKRGTVHSRHVAAWLRNRGLAPPNMAAAGKRDALVLLADQHADSAEQLAESHGTAPYLSADVRNAIVSRLGHLPHLHLGLRVKAAGGALDGALAYSRRLGDKRPGQHSERRRARAGLLGEAGVMPPQGGTDPPPPEEEAMTEGEVNRLAEDFQEYLPDGLIYQAGRVWTSDSRRARADEGPLADLSPVDVKLELDLRPSIKVKFLRAWLGNRGFKAAGSASRARLYLLVKEVAMRDALMQGADELPL